MNNYKCVIADKQLLNQLWNEKIKNHNNSEMWIKWKKIALRNYKTRITYVGLLDNKIITEATAIISDKDLDMQNKENLIDEKTAYLTSFSTNKEYEGKGYFSKLYKFMENDLQNKGFETLTLGVEPCETRNIQIYFTLGYTNYIKTAYEIYPSEKGKKTEKIIANYYSKKLN